MAGTSVIYRVERHAAARLNLVKESDQISEECKRFVEQLVLLSTEHTNFDVPKAALIDRLAALSIPNSPGVIARHLKTIEQRGVLSALPEKEFIGGKAFRVYLVRELHMLGPTGEAKAPAAKRTKKHIDRQLRLFDQSGTQLQFNDDQLPITQSLMCILDAGMRSSSSDASGKGGTVVSTYRINAKENVTITTSTSTEAESEIAILSDLRVVRALNAMLLDQLKVRLKESGIRRGSIREIGNALQIARQLATELFYIDIDDLCRRIGLRPWETNREIVRKIVRRIKDTKFVVDAEYAPSFKDRYFPDESATTGEYRFITEFYAAKEEQVHEQSNTVVYVERFYWMKFHSHIIANLLVDWLAFIGHPELFTEDSGLAQRFSNWLKAWIGVDKYNPKCNSEFTYTIPELHQLVLPHVRADNFQRDFINLLQRQVREGAGVEDKGCSEQWVDGEGDKVLTWFYGYFLFIDFSVSEMQAHCRKRGLRLPRSRKPVPLITISRDKDDLFVGDESSFNLIQDEDREARQNRLQQEKDDPDIETVTVTQFCQTHDLQDLLHEADRKKGSALSSTFRGQALDEAREAFIQHHVALDTDITPERHISNWIGWCANRLKRTADQSRVGENKASVSTRTRSLADDLGDRSWAK